MKKLILFICPLIIMAFFWNVAKGLTIPQGHVMLNVSPELTDMEKAAKGETVYVAQKDGTTVVLLPKVQSWTEYWRGLANWANSQIPSDILFKINEGKGLTAGDIKMLFIEHKIYLISVKGKHLQTNGIRDDGSTFDVFRMANEDEYIAYFKLSDIDASFPDMNIDLLSCSSGGCGNYAKRENQPVYENQPADTVHDIQYVDHDVYLPSDTVYVHEYRDQVEYKDNYVYQESPYQMQQPQYQMQMQYQGGCGGGMPSFNNGNVFAPSSSVTNIDDHSFVDNSVHNNTTIIGDTSHPTPTPVHDGPNPPPNPIQDNANPPPGGRVKNSGRDKVNGNQENPRATANDVKALTTRGQTDLPLSVKSENVKNSVSDNVRPATEKPTVRNPIADATPKQPAKQDNGVKPQEVKYAKHNPLMDGKPSSTNQSNGVKQQEVQYARSNSQQGNTTNNQMAMKMGGGNKQPGNGRMTNPDNRGQNQKNSGQMKMGGNNTSSHSSGGFRPESHRSEAARVQPQNQQASPRQVITPSSNGGGGRRR